MEPTDVIYEIVTDLLDLLQYFDPTGRVRLRYLRRATVIAFAELGWMV